MSAFEHNIVNSYLNGESKLSLSKEYGINWREIQNILNKYDIKNISKAKRNNPDLIENYFEKIDSPEKAYWIGWILTDGGVTKKHDLEISILKQDKYILESFQNDLKLLNNHVKNHGENYSRFSFSCKKICEDLKQYGIVPNKTMKLKFPKNIPSQYYSHLLRGMFDGDGGFTLGMTTRFYKHRNKSYTKPYQEFSFTGTYDMCENFHNILFENCSFSPKNINHNHNIYRVRWSNKEEIIDICRYLYQNCGDHFLQRKYDKYLRLLNNKEGVA